MSINTVDEERPVGSARDVLDYIAWYELLDNVMEHCDTIVTALTVMPTFLKNQHAAQRGRMIA